MMQMPDESPEDLRPVAWKWLVRFIWLFSIVIFQALELHRYLNGETYRPVFGLFAAVICALVIWLAANAFRNANQRRQARRRTR